MKDTGGSAFPGKICTGHEVLDGRPMYENTEGMTLRDYWMGQIKPAIIQGIMLRHNHPSYSDLGMLDAAHLLADKEVSKMIKERNK